MLNDEDALAAAELAERLTAQLENVSLPVAAEVLALLVSKHFSWRCLADGTAPADVGNEIVERARMHARSSADVAVRLNGWPSDPEGFVAEQRQRLRAAGNTPRRVRDQG